MNKIISLKSTLLLIGSALALGAGVSAVSSSAAFWSGLPGAAFLSLLILAGLYAAWRWAGRGRGLAWMVVAAFVLRLGAGATLTVFLPQWGYSNEEIQKAGYVFADAYQRDQQAWQMAQSGQALTDSFGANLASDQYGGLLALSALVYRALSPDLHRPLLMILLGAGVAALGIPFLWQAARPRWGERVATLSGWVLALYPESILLGSSQMREPFLITLIAIAFLGSLTWKTNRKTALIELGASLAVLFLFSWRVAVPVILVLVGWILLDGSSKILQTPRGALGWIAILGGAAALLFVSAWWIKWNVLWEADLTLANSGMIQVVIDAIGRGWLLPFVSVYGLFQPVLPAALTDGSVPLWQTISIVRAAGWWLLAPTLIYSLLIVWKTPDAHERRLLVWTSLVVWCWILVSSVRAGGDQWDNPRYRTMFLVWIALLAAWTWERVRQQKDVWLTCIYGVETAFFLVFLRWYIPRKFAGWSQLSYPVMALLFLTASAAILAWGWWKTRRKKMHPLT